MIAWTDTGTVAGFRLFLIVGSMIVGGIAALATVVGFFGTTWWPFDFAANLRWHLFWLLLVASVIYALIAKGWFLIILVGTAVVNGALIVPMWLGAQPESTGEDSLRIVQLDVSGGFDDRLAGFTWLEESDADLLLLAGASTVVSREVAHEDSDWVVLVEPDVDNTAGMVILAKQQWEVAVTPTGVGSDTVIRITAGDTTGSYEILTAWGPMATSADKADRLQARLDTIASLSAAATAPVVVVGNLGATVWTSTMSEFLTATGLRDATKGSGYLATSRSSGIPVIGGWLGLPLDVVLMSEDATPIELTTGPDVGVEHLPVVFVVGPVE